MAKTEISARAKRLWLRLTEWYGARFAEQYGTEPPPDWCRIVDSIDNSAVARGLSLIRMRHVEHPPTLPQFEAAMRPAPSLHTGPSPGDRLCAHIMREHGRRFTPKQLRGPWTYLGSETGQISGVVIDADGDSPGLRVMLADVDSDRRLTA